MNGSVVIERYRKISPETKIIMVSSQSNVEVSAKLIDSGIADYVVKGNDVVENLKKAINKALHKLI